MSVTTHPSDVFQARLTVTPDAVRDGGLLPGSRLFVGSAQAVAQMVSGVVGETVDDLFDGQEQAERIGAYRVEISPLDVLVPVEQVASLESLDEALDLED